MANVASTPDTVDLTERQHNFSAGPAALPLEVIEEVEAELPVYDETGASVMEISHRSDAYEEIYHSARERLRDLLGMGDEWNVLFVQGGASMQFHQVPLNFLREDETADYLNTGRWSVKAMREARPVGTVNEAASSEEAGFSYIPDPKTWQLSSDARYLHFTSNNTVNGTQFHFTPQSEAPLVADASSDFLSRPIDLDEYGLVYAGAQKNIGPAGVTVVLVRDDFLAQRKDDLPTMLDYETHVGRPFNTPPVFAVYVVEKVLAWLQDQGGVEAIAEKNRRKAGRLYEAIDSSDFYRGAAREDSRSLMNVTFRVRDEDLEDRFVTEAEEAGLLTLKGHRSVGGMRASIYNACPEEAVDTLIAFMEEFERTRG